ncbi:putative lysozyme-like domain [Rosellinia necatrix]|uniref:Putative lysozyme-like domain n=1 Tax=Rosellinia necatrix TaxID=77044 RepID=A0A1W2THU0_ROSNE|nr:putative lysozyme-like domain [Rosellinia necatrix]
MFQNIILAFAAIASLATAAPANIDQRGLATQEPVTIQQRGLSDFYRKYTGDGSAKAGWPVTSDWGEFEDLWKVNLPLIQKSCGWNNWGADNSADEINNLKSAITQVASETGVKSRFILLIVMQESKGCVRVPTTNNGVVNPGLMQSHNGSGTCAGVNPCPKSRIVQMIRDGTAGTSSGEGLKQILVKTVAHYGSYQPAAYYAAARLYNSGSVDYAHLENGFTSTTCYASDVANRAHGWTLASSTC